MKGQITHRKRPGRSVFTTIFISVLVILFVEIALLMASLNFSRVSEQLDQNAEDILDKQVENRCSYLESFLVGVQDLTDLSEKINTQTQQLVDSGAIRLDELDAGTEGNPLAWIASLCAIRCGLLDVAERSMRRSEANKRAWLECELLLAEGEKSIALDKALDEYDGSGDMALALGKCMASNSRHSEAVVFLRKARRCMVESGCLFRLDEELVWEADSYLAMGDRETAARLLESAACAAIDDRAGKLLMRKARVLSSEDLVCLQGVHV